MRQLMPLATFACTGIALGAAIAWAVPTEPRTARNSELKRLSQVYVVAYSGAEQAIAGPDSYPVSYSPQWLAIARAAERQRMAKWALPDPGPPLAYDQPPPERDLAVERAGIGAQGDSVATLPEPEAGGPPPT